MDFYLLCEMIKRSNCHFFFFCFPYCNCKVGNDIKNNLAYYFFLRNNRDSSFTSLSRQLFVIASTKKHQLQGKES